MKSFNFKKNCPKHSNFMESCPRLGYFTLKMLSYSTKSYSIKGKQTERITKKISRFSKYINPYLPIYLMDKGFITINNLDSIIIKKLSNGCFDFGCFESNRCFRFFIIGKIGYFQELTKCNDFEKTNSLMFHDIPNQIKYFIQNKKTNNTFITFGDCDLDLMFSRKEKLIVGSYDLTDGLI